MERIELNKKERIQNANSKIISSFYAPSDSLLLVCYTTTQGVERLKVIKASDISGRTLTGQFGNIKLEKKIRSIEEFKIVAIPGNLNGFITNLINKEVLYRGVAFKDEIDVLKSIITQNNLFKAKSR